MCGVGEGGGGGGGVVVGVGACENYIEIALHIEQQRLIAK